MFSAGIKCNELFLIEGKIESFITSLWLVGWKVLMIETIFMSELLIIYLKKSRPGFHYILFIVMYVTNKNVQCWTLNLIPRTSSTHAKICHTSVLLWMYSVTDLLFGRTGLGDVCINKVNTGVEHDSGLVCALSPYWLLSCLLLPSLFLCPSFR